MAKNEKTSKRVAKIASRIMSYKGELGDVRAHNRIIVEAATAKVPANEARNELALETIPFRLSDIRALAASVLTQAPDRPKKKR